MIKSLISNDIQKCFKKLKLECTADFKIETQSNPEFGDYSTNVCLVNAKANSTNPRHLATQVCEQLATLESYIKAEPAGPGFINLWPAPGLYHNALNKINSLAGEFGRSETGKNQKVLIEFISANPTGPLNVVSARAAAYGDSLYRIMAFAGYKPMREFYINDAGNQVDILAESLELRYREVHGETIDEFPIEAYHGEYVKELAAKLYALEGTKLLSMSEKDRLAKMKQFALEEILEMQRTSLENFDVHIDSWISERSLRKQGIVQEVMSYLTEAGCTYDKEEAVWFSSTRFGDEKDRVLMKSDGSYTYLVPDIGYHITKYQRGFDVIIDVLGPDHHGHVAKLTAAIKALQMDLSKLEVVYLQQVNLFDDGERVKMSKRAGKIVSMDELIEEVGREAARFFFIDRRSSAHLNFDLELATTQSSENPVFYCQYAHARINSVLSKAKKELKIRLDRIAAAKLKNLTKPVEIEIIKKMLDFEEVVAQAANSREPHRVAAYTMELAGMFHRYYQKFSILNLKSKDLIEARLYLIMTVKVVLASALNLLGVTAPEKM